MFILPKSSRACRYAARHSTKLLHSFSAFFFACFLTSCGPKSVLLDYPNTVEIETRPITKADGEWTEITIKQKLSLKSPMVVQGLRDGIADILQYSVQNYSDQTDAEGRHIGRAMIIHARPIKPNQNIVLLQRDFIFHPSIVGWPRLEISSKPEQQ